MKRIVASKLSKTQNDVELNPFMHILELMISVIFYLSYAYLDSPSLDQEN